MQHTLAQDFTLQGIGLHKAEPVTVTVAPGRINTGIVFVRADLDNAEILAHWSGVEQTPLCTRLHSGDISVSTIEHLMAAFIGCGIDNARVVLNAAEMPILDGSAKPYVDAIRRAGIKKQEAPRQVFEIIKPVEVSDGDKYVRLEPYHAPYFLFSIDFESAAIGRQDLEYVHEDMDRFAREIAPARSFAQARDVLAAQAAGMALGATMEGGILVDGDTVKNPEGLRFDDEFVRHKILDAMGDMSLAGGTVRGKFISHKGGHTLTNRALHALFSDPANYRIDNDYIGLHEQVVSSFYGRVSSRIPADIGGV